MNSATIAAISTRSPKQMQADALNATIRELERVRNELDPSYAPLVGNSGAGLGARILAGLIVGAVLFLMTMSSPSKPSPEPAAKSKDIHELLSPSVASQDALLGRRDPK